MKHKIIFFLLSCSLLYIVSGTDIYASENSNLSDSYMEIQYEHTMTAENRVVQLEYHYRTYNGYVQYRRWDVKNQCWYDPEWITIGKA